MKLNELWMQYEADKRILGFSLHTLKAYSRTTITPIRSRRQFLLRGHRFNRDRYRFISYPQYDGDHVVRSGAKPRYDEWTAIHAI
jgi:hypothetical protein